MNPRNILYCSLLWFMAFMANAQMSRLDSLKLAAPQIEDDSLRFHALYRIVAYYSRNNPDSFTYYSDRLLYEAKEVNSLYTMNKVYNSKGAFYYRLGVQDSSTYYFEKAYEAAMANNDEKAASRNLSNLGAIKFMYGDYQGALESFILRLRVVENDPEQKVSYGKTLNNISGVYIRLGNDSLAVTYGRKALALQRTLNNSSDVAGTLNTLGAAYLESEKPDSSLFYSGEALSLAEETGNDEQAAVAITNIGAYYGLDERKNLDSLLFYHKKALVLTEKGKIPADLALARLNLAYVYNEMKQYRQGLAMGQKSLAIYDSLGHKREIARAHGEIAEALEGLGRYREAIVYLRQHFTLNDTLFNIEKSEAISELQIEYETDKKNQQIALQESQLETSAAIISRQSLVRNIAIGGAAVLVLVVILIYRNNRLKTQASQEISEKNVQLGKALSERESLLKEIHHRVKNNLQVIASLLYLQSDKTDDVSVKKLLEEGQGRVRSMALIHQKLYENEDLKHIPFEEYLGELVGEIQKTFGARAEAVALEIEAKGIQFDVDTAVPLGLIINELSTNAFKYAYTDKMGGASFSVKLKQHEGQYEMTVSDNGLGIPDEALNATQSSSLGLRLTRMLSDQLEGEYAFDNSEGTRFELKFAV